MRVSFRNFLLSTLIIGAIGCRKARLANSLCDCAESGAIQFVDSVFVEDENVYLETGLVIPNIFTPNGDDINDSWRVDGLWYFQASVKIMNPRSVFNKVVYENDNYENNWRGDNVKDGKYDYELVLKDGRRFTGRVCVLRENIENTPEDCKSSLLPPEGVSSIPEDYALW